MVHEVLKTFNTETQWHLHTHKTICLGHRITICMHSHLLWNEFITIWNESIPSWNEFIPSHGMFFSKTVLDQP